MADRQSRPGTFELNVTEPSRLDFDHHREERHRSMSRLEAVRASSADRAPGDGHAWNDHHQHVPGPFAGRGPRGYRRADDRICEELHDRLTANGFIDATDIKCLVQDGEVTLSGVVNSRQTKRAAEDVADGIQGVRDVHNNLRIEARDETRPAGGKSSRRRNS